MSNMNIRYKSKELLEFYRQNRQKWDELYPSEKRVFEKIIHGRKKLGALLDVGCACGGLGLALGEKYMLSSYTGIDINNDVIDWTKKNRRLKVPSKFLSGDIVGTKGLGLYDTVVSLGCADWNIETEKIINSCWKRVEKGGTLVISLRLTPQKGVNDIRKSFQYINFSGNERLPEVANYVVLNINDVLRILEKLTPSPELVGSYGYRGSPSPMARTPYKKIVFSVFYVKKKQNKNKGKVKYELNLPKL